MPANSIAPAIRTGDRISYAQQTHESTGQLVLDPSEVSQVSKVILGPIQPKTPQLSTRKQTSAHTETVPHGLAPCFKLCKLKRDTDGYKPASSFPLKLPLQETS